MNAESVFPIDDPEFDAAYAEEAAMVDASELIASALETSGMSRTELADKLSVSKSEITARLAGERNITVRKLAATLHALGQRLELSLAGDTEITGDTEGKRHVLQRYERWRPTRRGEAAEHSTSGHRNVVHVRAWQQARQA